MKKVLVIIFFIFLNITQLTNAKISIIVYVDNEIITNHDIATEIEYLKILNPNIVQLKDEQIFTLARTSVINEIIKKKEIEKFISLDKQNNLTVSYLKDLYSKLNFNSEIEFENELIRRKTYSLEQIKKKINIELLWNELIYSRHSNQLKIDKKKLLDKINKSQNKKQKEYLLSEIVFNKKKDESLNSVINRINESIDEIGFNNTANIFSISESSKFGGRLNWVDESSLSEVILKKLIALKENEFSEPIKIRNNYLILKIEKIRINEVKIDENKELEKLIKIETNRQLNQFSRIYFDKAKINYSINEN